MRNDNNNNKDERKEKPPPITDDELVGTIKRMTVKKTTPGSDGVPGKILAATIQVISEEIKSLFNECLLKGEFPVT